MITVQTLVDLEACSDQVTLFREFLGDREGVEPTPEVIREAALYGLDIWWAQHMGVITSYSIHYTKLYDRPPCAAGR